ncbi:MAG: 3-deoxy-D-manno-octulosonic acid transferase [Bacteroidales bacterium]|nr:3-deoxy-D-manno-octulosonic acid transferase [Bacteroidales bacterium]
MQYIYLIVIKLYGFLIWIAHFFNEKARLWINGRKNIWYNLSKVSNKWREKVIWLHVSSLGEFEQGRPIIEAIKKQYPHTCVILTFFSPSGYEIRKNYEKADFIFYLPLDGKRNAKKFFDYINPSLVIFVKYDFWYFYINEAHKRNIPVILISAVFKSNSIFFRWYGAFFRKIITKFDEIFVQEDESKKLIETFARSVVVAGDTRCDRVLQIASTAKVPDKIIALVNNRLVIVVGSAWKEDMLILKPLFGIYKHVLWIIAPHQIDSGSIKAIATCIDKPYTLYSQITGVANFSNNFIIIDNIGMLSSLYSIAQIAYVGGGFGKGIHNILEPAVYGIPVIFGPNHHKFNEAKDLIKCNGGFSIHSSDEAKSIFSSIIENENLRIKYGNAARNYVVQQAGATNKIMTYIEELLFQ